MDTLVVCVDRGGSAVSDGPVVGRDAIRELVTQVGTADPEDSQVNCLLETLRLADDLEADGDAVVVAAVNGGGGRVAADRTVARQTDELVEVYAPDSAVVVTDSAEDERLVPIIESRVRVDAVDRVVVRQAHDIESTYYLLKQFLADEELRTTILVPLGAAMLAFPVLLLTTESLSITISALAAVIGLFVLYKGLGIDDWLAGLPGRAREAFYSGQLSLVTYVVAAGLALVGLFAGAIGVSNANTPSTFVLAMQFGYDAVPWLTLGALAASTGRLIDEFLRTEQVQSALLNLPFGVVAIGLVIRGFAGYFLERAGAIGPLVIGGTAAGPVTVRGFALTIGVRLVVFVAAGLLVSLVGVQFSSYLGDTRFDDGLPERP